jgi:hypothetical protein
VGHSEACHFPGVFLDSTRRGVTLMLQISWLESAMNFVASFFMAEGQNWA